MRRSIGISLASLITSACAIGWAAQFGWAADHGPVRVDHRNLPTRGCNRGEHPMMVFDREGNFLRSWGEGQYPPAHGVHMAPDVPHHRWRAFRAQGHARRRTDG